MQQSVFEKDAVLGRRRIIITVFKRLEKSEILYINIKAPVFNSDSHRGKRKEVKV
jgi:hypothetical protein